MFGIKKQNNLKCACTLNRRYLNVFLYLLVQQLEPCYGITNGPKWQPAEFISMIRYICNSPTWWINERLMSMIVWTSWKLSAYKAPLSIGTVDIWRRIVNERLFIRALNLTLRAHWAYFNALTCNYEGSRATSEIHWLLLFLDPLFIALRLSDFIFLHGLLLLKGVRSGGMSLFFQSCSD